MKTCGMEGEVVGKAASICALQNCTPREVYAKHLSDLEELLRLPGKARRLTVTDSITVAPDALPLAGPKGAMTGLDPTKLPGLVIDDQQAKGEGYWTAADKLKGYVAYGYLYASADSGASIRYEFQCRRPANSTSASHTCQMRTEAAKFR